MAKIAKVVERSPSQGKSRCDGASFAPGRPRCAPSISGQDASDHIAEISFRARRSARRGIFVSPIAIVAILFCLPWPAVVRARAQLLTSPRSVELVAPADGTIALLTVNAGNFVHKGELLGVVAPPEDLASAQLAISQANLFTAAQSKPIIECPESIRLTGPFRPAYESLCARVAARHRYSITNGTSQKLELARRNLALLRQRRAELGAKREALSAAVAIADTRLEAGRDLLARGYMSRSQLSDREYVRIQALVAVENVKLEDSETLRDVTRVDAQLGEITREHQSASDALDHDVLAAAGSLRAQVTEWRRHYGLIAPIAGTARFAENFNEGGFVAKGRRILVVSPSANSLIIESVLDRGPGPVEVGSAALLEVDGYPAAQYGYLRGTVSEIAAATQNGAYVVRAIADHGLITDQNFLIPDRSGLGGVATFRSAKRTVWEQLISRVQALVSDVSL